MHVCRLCGDPSEIGEDICPSCSVDVEMEIDAMLDAPTPESD